MTIKNRAIVVGLLMLCLTGQTAWADETVSFKSVNYPDRWIRHYNFEGRIDPIDPNDTAGLKDATFILRPALSGTPGAVSFELVNYPGFFLRHEDFRLKLHATNTDHHPQSFRADASFLPRAGLAGGSAVSYELVNFPNHFIRHSDYKLWVHTSRGEQTFSEDASFRKVSPLWAGGGGGGGGLSAEAQAALNAHNGYRAKHCVPNLAWSAQLASGAQGWANRCEREADGSFKHSLEPGLGENLYWAPPGAPNTGTDAAAWFYGEAPRYDYNNAYASYIAGDSDRSREVRHFTQVVWRATAQVGCAVAQCGDTTYWVCRYSPPGNWNAGAPGELAKNVPPPCK